MIWKKGAVRFLHIAKGAVTLNGETLKEGDAAEISDIATIDVVANADSELLLFDMA